MKSKKILVLFMYVCLFTACHYNKKHNSSHSMINPLLGSWKMLQVHWESEENTYSIDEAHEGIYLFTPHSYSIQWTPTREPRSAFKKLSEPTDEELMAGFKSVVFNAGSYEFTDSTITTTAYIAKVPGFEGGKQFYTYKIVGDILTITMIDETYPDGSKPDWSGKYSTKFVMQRVKK